MDAQRKSSGAQNRTVSPIRKIYIARLIGRCAILIWSIVLWWTDRGIFDILEGTAFFEHFSILHVLWMIWVLDMLAQVLPVRQKLALGSQKYMAFRFRPARREPDPAELKIYTNKMAKRAALVFALWSCLTGVIGVLFYSDILGKAELLLISVAFYVCDLICVLVWCPFRLMLGNRCCTTCRIFNWDHLMMFSPLIFAGGFYATTLVVMAVAVFLLWEITVLRHPERFWEQTNAALKCGACTDKLCTQYCGRRKSA